MVSHSMVQQMKDIRYHGNGFIQVVLNPVTRMHIYSPHFLEDFPRVDNARIHDHKFTFTSQILLGRLINRTYNVWAPGGPHGYYRVDETQKDEPLVRICDCGLVDRSIEVYSAGESYDFGGPRNFHDAFAEELTVTVMTKTKVDLDHQARVVSINDVTPDNAFGSQPDYNDMRREVQRVMRILT